MTDTKVVASDLNNAIVYIGNDPQTIAEVEEAGGIVAGLDFIPSFLVNGVKIKSGLNSVKSVAKFQLNLTDLFGIKNFRTKDGTTEETKFNASTSLAFTPDWAEEGNVVEASLLQSIENYGFDCEGKFDEKGNLVLGGEVGGFLCQIAPYSQTVGEKTQVVKYWGVYIQLGEVTPVTLSDGTETQQFPIEELEIHNAVLIKQIYGTQAKDAGKAKAKRSELVFEEVAPKKVVTPKVAAPVAVVPTPVVPAAVVEPAKKSILSLARKA